MHDWTLQYRRVVLGVHRSLPVVKIEKDELHLEFRVSLSLSLEISLEGLRE